jgi:photosystem II stability/assembly factor-like uncharacterized protein
VRTPISLPNTVLIDAPSGTVVWVLVGDQAQGSRIFRSSDRGDSWEERSVPPIGPVELSFIDDREGWAMVPTGGCCVPPPAGAQCGSPVALSHTADGAATWQAIVPTGMDPPGPCKSTVRFVDAQRGFIAAFDPNGSPLVYRTANGGRAWTASQRFPDPPGFTTRPGGPTLGVGKVGVFGSTVLVVAFVRDSPVTGQSYIYRSADSGSTWTYASAAPNAFQDIAFVTATRWLQLSAPGDSKETTDGGATWHAYATEYRQAAPVGPTVVFGDAQVGYATTRGSIQRTSDGGVRWTGIRTPGTF